MLCYRPLLFKSVSYVQWFFFFFVFFFLFLVSFCLQGMFHVFVCVVGGTNIPQPHRGRKLIKLEHLKPECILFSHFIT